jgi:hypothetical protein
VRDLKLENARKSAARGASLKEAEAAQEVRSALLYFIVSCALFLSSVVSRSHYIISYCIQTLSVAQAAYPSISLAVCAALSVRLTIVSLSVSLIFNRPSFAFSKSFLSFSR